MTKEIQHFQTQSLGEQIKAIRNHLGISQSELGRRLGITQVAVSGLETSGANMRAETRSKIAQALGAQLIHGQLVPPWMEE